MCFPSHFLLLTPTYTVFCKKKVNQLLTIPNDELTKLSLWFKASELNISKTTTCFFQTKKNIMNETINLNYKCMCC